MFRLPLAVLLAIPLFASAADPATKKVVLIAGAKDANHPAGTHEYERTVKLLKYGLETSVNCRGITCEVHFNGWPKNESTLDAAAAIVLVSSGSDRKTEDHPLLVGERMKVIAKQMKRGCGLAVIHWSVFFPNEKVGDDVLEWVGGHFDYQSGPPPQRWSSAITTTTYDCKPGTAAHPVSRGLQPFKIKDEFYYKIRFRPNDDRFKPLLIVNAPNVPKDQVVAWAVERKDGGRGFGFTGGHFFDNWYDPNFRRLVMNAIVWIAKGDVPAGGVESATLDANTLDLPDPTLADWTPRPAQGKSEPWERKSDPDWDEDRFRSMDTGPAFNATFRYPHEGSSAMSYKGTAVRFRDGSSVLFDRNTLKLEAGWSDGFLIHSVRRFGLLNTPLPRGRMVFSLTPGPGWGDAGAFEPKSATRTAPLPPKWGLYLGHYLTDDGAVFYYRIHGTDVIDAIRPKSVDGQPGFVRTLLIGPVEHRLTLNDASPITIEASKKPQLVTIGYGAAKTEELQPIPLTTAPGKRRWGEPIVTRLVRGPENGAFRIDTLSIPYENRFKALFFCTGLDFLPDQRIAVCTCHGDVWIVDVDEKKDECRWQRFATGLYHPLGLKVVGKKIVVLERGQLTRLHDINGDGEADYYESLAGGWDTGAGEHSYDTCLETDRNGNFFFFKTGDTNLPTGGTLLKVSPDGARTEIFATGFRHPIGMGMSPTGILTGADQEGNWMPATRVDEYHSGGFYGDMRAHHRETAPKIYDGPLCWLPREVDNSAGGQVWVPSDATGWGPLAGKPLHFSYGRCKAYVLLREQLGEGRVQGGVSDLNLRFLSGVCRGRFAPNDWLYVCGLNGWQTAAQSDGCLQRVVPLFKPIDTVVQSSILKNSIILKFGRKLSADVALNPNNYKVAQWNYRWSGQYGSKRWKVSNPQSEGQDDVPVSSVRLVDASSVELMFDSPVVPVMQMQIGYRTMSSDWTPISGSVYLTIHGSR